MRVYLFYFVAFYNYARSLKRQSTWGVISHPVHWLKGSGRSHWPLSSIRSSDSHGVLNLICPWEEGGGGGGGHICPPLTHMRISVQMYLRAHCKNSNS